jgi:hypothetical protein
LGYRAWDNQGQLRVNPFPTWSPWWDNTLCCVS